MPTSPPEKTNTGLDQNLAGGLAYLLGPVTGIVLLLIEPENRYVRFHAFQSLFTFVSIAVLVLILSGVPVIGRLVWAASFLATMVLWVYLMYKALMGERYKLPFIGDWAENQLK